MTSVTGEAETFANLSSSDVSSQSMYQLHVDSFERIFVNRRDASFNSYIVSLLFHVIEYSLLDVLCV
jgi:hypothetical protein